MNIADELRAETKRITDELKRIGKRYEGADWAGIRPSDAAAAATIITELQAHICTCSPERCFEIDTARADAPGYRAMERAAIDRMLFGAE